jgi:hypothetical protein
MPIAGTTPLDRKSEDRDRRVLRYRAELDELHWPPGLPPVQPLPLRIAATGDSWFDYPLRDPFLAYTDVIECLRGALRDDTVIGNIAFHGAQVVPVAGASPPPVAGAAQLQRLRTMLAAGADVMLVSGGGNDVADGPKVNVALNPLYVLLRDRAPGMPVSQALNTGEVDQLFGRVRTSLLDVVAARDAERPGIPIIFNAYGFCFPDNRAAQFLLSGIAGPWLFPALQARGWMTSPTALTDLDVGRAIIRELLTRYRAMLAALDGHNLHVADTQAVPLEDRLADWANELHPTKSGFRQVAAAFQAKLVAIFGQPVVGGPVPVA